MAHFQSVDDYINNFDGIAKQRLLEVRQLVKEQLPAAQERISYNMPAYFLNGKLVVYFSGFKNHIGMYPGRINNAMDRQIAAQFLHGKSTLQFPHDQPLPTEVIQKFLQNRVRELS